LNKNHNPFSGIFDSDLTNIIVPKYDIAVISKLISTHNANVAIELIGRQGRGKTTHLKYYQQQLGMPIFELSEEHASLEDILASSAELVLVDSIHHLNFRERIQLFTVKKAVIYTTHTTRYLSAKLAKKPLKQLKFKNINSKTLQEIINKRLVFFDNKQQLNEQEIQSLINKYGDNYRFIINHLYTKYNGKSV